MKLYFKQRFFSWFDSYDIYYEGGDVAYTVEGKLSWGHCLHILDPYGQHIATVKQQVLTFLPKFDLYVGERCIGTIRKEFTFFHPSFTMDFCGWTVEGSFMEWDYTIQDGPRTVASISKELFNWTDTYTIDVADPGDALYALMVVLAIDAVLTERLIRNKKSAPAGALFLFVETSCQGFSRLSATDTFSATRAAALASSWPAA